MGLSFGLSFFLYLLEAGELSVPLRAGFVTVPFVVEPIDARPTPLASTPSPRRARGHRGGRGHRISGALQPVDRSRTFPRIGAK